jgi:DNA mismatch repair protein MutS
MPQESFPDFEPVAPALPEPRARTSAEAGRSSPMMEQFYAAKREAAGALLFFRMGDFYELFGEDALVASRALGIALTSRSKGEDALPMAGVPVRSYESYLLRLVRQGHRVAICEQLGDPRSSKGIVERGLVRVVTPGTLTEEDALDAGRPNELACAWSARNTAALAWVDVSTGRMRALETTPERLADELLALQPAELLCSSDWSAGAAALFEQLGLRPTEREPWRFERDAARRALERQFGVATLAGYGFEETSPAIPAAGALLDYLHETQRSSCAHVRRLERVEPSAQLVLDRATRACLELVHAQRPGEDGRERREGTLLHALDATLTPMGARALREWLLAPLREVAAIRHRQGAVAELVAEARLRDELRALLRPVLDIERLCARVSTGRAGPRDLGALGTSLAACPALRAALAGAQSAALALLAQRIDPLEDVCGRLRSTLVDAPPLALREGGIVRDGCSSALDELRAIARDGQQTMALFQAREVERSGIASLKLGYHSVFGYYIEVPRGQLARVPAHYVRKQTVKNAERYVTPELKEFEDKVLRAQERSCELEYELFVELRESVAREVGRVLDCARALAELDVLASFAQRAAEQRYVAPVVDDEPRIAIRDGRHPVIERSPRCASFVPNDALLDADAHGLTILTGPNMAGKSTYMRQVGLIVLMAQMGCFVPASAAEIGVVDRIFTRIGAGDDISRGESTFMVEMVEIASILNNASERSLILLDEVGRGTSTFDGLALAWAIAEHVSQRTRARTLFATHYHQLTELAQRYPGICNKSVAVREWGDEIVFLHKIVEGGTDRSYGIQVARLAGVPHELLARARAILHDLEEDAEGLAPRIAGGSLAASEPAQSVLFAARRNAPQNQRSALARELELLEPERMTPIEALLALQRLRALVAAERGAASGASATMPATQSAAERAP